MKAIDTCPYCGREPESAHDLRTECEEETNKLIVCVDMECNHCKRLWTVIARPTEYHTYDGPNGDFNPDPKPLE